MEIDIKALKIQVDNYKQKFNPDEIGIILFIERIQGCNEQEALKIFEDIKEMEQLKELTF